MLHVCFRGLISMGLPFHDEHPVPGGVDRSSCLEALGEAHGFRAACPSTVLFKDVGSRAMLV